ncbi:serine/threonine-protein kinase [Granulicella aggregans]|uniref:non-specific serine/threonine protein kinase n=1 Tax=Granulicella aggregans TaxID=474949 RepID=A0A7W7ZBV8_9BACT|nr:serine/threonine-protein kinase [Granulicella aggregans]MBB5057021.1 serine/threonine-protein kinase [Granulicella aggregans]
MAFEPGGIIGEYTIEAALGHGGLGTVYRVQHRISQRQEAMKVLLPERTGTAESAERFRREIQMLASLNHPNIARLHTAFYFEEQLIMMMELVEGEDLRALSRRTSIAIPLLLDYSSQALRALEYAHARGVVHRDIKPANMMVSPAGQMKVLDFGLAQNGTSTELTLAGSVVGSPIYMSPEQVRGEKATSQSDLYSFGVTLYELIAGDSPIQGKNAYELMMGHLNHVPKPLRVVRPEIPAHVSDAVARALEKEPVRRFASAAEFLDALNARVHAADDLTATLPPVNSSHRPGSDDQNKTPTGAVPQPLEPLVKHLASFIGPIAKITVLRLARKTSDIDQLYQAAAKEIDDPAERQKFLRTRPR